MTRLSRPRSLLSRTGTSQRARRLGTPIFDLHGQSELLALTYSLGGLAVVTAWIVDPGSIGNRAGMAALLTLVFAAAAVIYALRNHHLRYTGDVAIVGSLVLIDFAIFFTKLHAHPGLLSPFFVWVGFAAPLWFPRRRALFYAFLAVLASGIVIVVAGTAAAVAGWVITMVTLIVALCITSFLTDALVGRERLAVVGEMASVIGHELRNPLGAVSNALFLLRHSLHGEVTEKQEANFEMAEREIAKAAAILGDLRAYVHPGPPVLGPVDLRTLVTEVLEVAPAPVGVDVRLDVASITLFADRDQLSQVLTNLVTNSYDALENQGSLRITASQRGSWVLVTVEDDGSGIEQSQAESVFEPFYTTKSRGTGLGLAIVRRLVEAHGGTVHLDTDPEKGTRFVMRFPVRPPRRSGSEIPEVGMAPEPPSTRAPDTAHPTTDRQSNTTGSSEVATRSQ
ncbi:MAG TPA: ATP-binding protein [Acidimicrobiales bacterium]